MRCPLCRNRRRDGAETQRQYALANRQTVNPPRIAGEDGSLFGGTEVVCWWQQVVALLISCLFEIGMGGYNHYMRNTHFSRRIWAFLFTATFLIFFLLARIPRGVAGAAVAALTHTPTATLTPVPIGMVLPTLEAPTELRLDGAIFSWKKAPSAPSERNYLFDIDVGAGPHYASYEILRYPVSVNNFECFDGSDGRCLIRLHLNRTYEFALKVVACEKTEPIPQSNSLWRCIENPKNYRPSALATLIVPAIPTPAIGPESTAYPASYCPSDHPLGLNYDRTIFSESVEYREPEDLGGSLICAW